MSNLTSSKLYVQLESVQTRDPVGESVMQTMGGTTNFLLDTQRYQHEFKLNGPIKTFSGQVGVDGLLPLSSDVTWEIYDVAMYGEIMGLSGHVEFDLLSSTFPSGTFTSIFSTKPQISFNAANYTTVHVGDVVANTVAPILTSNPLQVGPKTRFRLEVTNMQGGSPRNFGLWLYFRGKAV